MGLSDFCSCMVRMSDLQGWDILPSHVLRAGAVDQARERAIYCTFHPNHPQPQAAFMKGLVHRSCKAALLVAAGA